jgi:hypothetical protein
MVVFVAARLKDQLETEIAMSEAITIMIEYIKR